MVAISALCRGANSAKTASRGTSEPLTRSAEGKMEILTQANELNSDVSDSVRSTFRNSSILEVNRHRKDIDGLRCIAVLAVVGFHCKVQGLSGGFVGVDVFFVISGYLICALIVRDLDQNAFSIARFYERRCKRILPALVTVLLFCVTVSMCIASPYEAR